MIINESIRQKIDALRPRFPTEQSLLLPLLHEIQEKEGWISNEAIKEAAAFLHLAVARVEEVVSFYTMYNREPVGKKHIQICTNIACFLRGADQLVGALEKKLCIRAGETTSDGKYTLSKVECLASCGTAPVMQVNKDYHESLNLKKVLDLIEGWDREMANGI